MHLQTLPCRSELVFSLHLFREARGHDLSSALQSFSNLCFLYTPEHLRNTSGTVAEYLRNTSSTPLESSLEHRKTSGKPPEYRAASRNTSGIPPEQLRNTSGTLPGILHSFPEHVRNTSRNTAQPSETPPEYLRNSCGTPPEHLHEYRTASRNTSGTPPGIPHSLPEHLRNTPGTVAECLRNTSRTPPGISRNTSGTPPQEYRTASRNTSGIPAGPLPEHLPIKCLRQAVPLVLTVRLGSFARRCRARRLGGERPFAEASSP